MKVTKDTFCGDELFKVTICDLKTIAVIFEVANCNLKNGKKVNIKFLPKMFKFEYEHNTGRYSKPQGR